MNTHSSSFPNSILHTHLQDPSRLVGLLQDVEVDSLRSGQWA